MSFDLYSYKEQEPKILPFRQFLDDGTTKTSLNELSKEELEELGFFGPITKPSYNKNTQKIVWNKNKYEVIDLSEEEIKEKKYIERKEELKKVDYYSFYKMFFSSKIYEKLRRKSLESPLFNILCNEIFVIFDDRKSNKLDSSKIQKYINILFFTLDPTEEETEQLKNIMSDSNLNILYSIPDKEYISSHTYCPKTNSIIKNSPFASWTLEEGMWKSPIPYPTDGKIYKWNEDKLSWISIN